ncbi:hypothetical protein OKA04_04760 [Luteolibacter flavescens]|uniref:Uncharacterized protein n=1 Tax=Luteolibacter flavescens TaxID=1859460 RepID=A0ABT3FKD1_9BACT|nr:hypothetical protein [Luteolibacter flavescens]MCW1884028.1 hypothetical protein [Luteolibacter flavescens]
MSQEPQTAEPASTLEGFLIILCMVCPGLAAAVFMRLAERLLLPSFQGGMTGVVLLFLWFAFLLFCCGFAGWISASKVAPQNRMREGLKSGTLMFMFQLPLAPVICVLSFTILGRI